MTVRVYRSTDVGAPVTSTSAGGNVAILDACLVDGYGSKSPSGWSIPFETGSQYRVYRQGAGGMDLSVNDANNAASFESNVAAYERATAHGSGFTSPFGGGAGLFNSSALKIRQSATWIVLADDQTVMLWKLVSSVWYGFYFGDFYSYVPDDQYGVIIRGNTNILTTNNELDYYHLRSQYGSWSGDQAKIARAYHGGGASIVSIPVTDYVKAGMGGSSVSADGNSALPLAAALPYPNPVDGGVYIAPIEITENIGSGLSGALRGRYRGLHMLCHNPASVANEQTISGGIGTEYEGRTFEVLKPGTTGFNCFLLETSDTWETN